MDSFKRGVCNDGKLLPQIQTCVHLLREGHPSGVLSGVEEQPYIQGLFAASMKKVIAKNLEIMKNYIKKNHGFHSKNTCVSVNKICMKKKNIG